MDQQERPLSVVLFSGTDDKLNAAAVLAVGAAAMGRQVNIFVQYYALDAFRTGRVTADHKLSPEATPEQTPAVRARPGNHWSELLKQAKDVGEVDIQACALSMDMFHLKKGDFCPEVDDVISVGQFYEKAAGGQIIFT